MRVIVAGSGIGGLVTAMALHQRGIEVTVYEAVTELLPLGVGLNVLPHAMAELDAIGVMDAIVPLGVKTAELCYFNRHGQLIWREPRGLDAGYPVPQVSIHRGRLQLALRDAAIDMLPPDSFRYGHSLRSFSMRTDGRVQATLLNRHSDTEIVDVADVVVAADGIHSAARRAMYPQEGLPQWSGNILWRAVSRTEPYLTGRSMFMAGHRPHKFVAYPISEVGEDGRCEVNWIAELDRRDQGMPAREDWNKRGNTADFLPRFADWAWDWLDIPSLITSAQTVYEFPIVDRDPLPRWTHGRVTLLGDAAHPMYPVGSNGASQAILDARSLADALHEEADIDTALARYEADRREKTARIVLTNRQHGPEKVMDLAEERAPKGFIDLTTVFADGELEGIAASYKQVAGFARK